MAQVPCGVRYIVGSSVWQERVVVVVVVIVCVVVVVVGTVVVVRLYVGGSMQGANERPLLARTASG
jgi:hypothetical protein